MKELNPPAAVRPAEDVDAHAINAEHEMGQQAQRMSLGHYRRCGELLAMKKASLKHGQWGKWLAKNCPRIGDRQARRYMEFAKSDVTSDLEAEWQRICGNVPEEDEPEPTDEGKPADDAGPVPPDDTTDDTTDEGTTDNEGTDNEADDEAADDTTDEAAGQGGGRDDAGGGSGSADAGPTPKPRPGPGPGPRPMPRPEEKRSAEDRLNSLAGEL
jgi:hypothetical protein